MAIKNNEFTNFGMSSSAPTTAEKINKINNELSIDNQEVKFATPKGKATVVATEDQVTVSNEGNGIIVNQIGTVVDGLFHIGRQPSDIRVSTFWTLNNELLTTLPSTTYTPIPVLVYSEPADVKYLAALMSFMAKV